MSVCCCYSDILNVFFFFSNLVSVKLRILESSEKQRSASPSSVSPSEKTAQILPPDPFIFPLLPPPLFPSPFLRMKELIAENAAVFLSAVLLQLPGFSASLNKKKLMFNKV